jgi:hypothetical protein
MAVVNRQAGIMLKAAEQLGFTPTSRSRIHLMDAVSNEGDDEWDQIDRMRHA